MFEELETSLRNIDRQITQLRTAVEHINAAKAAAEAAVNAANTTNTEFKEHLRKVISATDSILKPHKELIATTENLTKTIEAIDFPKQLKWIKIIAIATGAVALIGTVLILIFCHK